MAKLAIRGHATRGKEVIEILEMLGGRIMYTYNGDDDTGVYFIDGLYIMACKYKDINCEKYKIFTLEGFLKEFPYKIGDKVQHKGATSCGTVYVIERMKWANNHTEYEIRPLYDYNHTGLVTLCVEDLQPYKEETMEDNIIDTVKESDDRYRIVLNHQFDMEVDEGEYYAVRRKPQYPNTYEECLKILECNVGHTIPMNHGHKGLLIMKLQQLLIFRDAYWKLVGDWKPDWEDDTNKYVITNYNNHIVLDVRWHSSTKLSFPNKEIRGAFYENFKDLIEECKELL